MKTLFRFSLLLMVSVMGSCYYDNLEEIHPGSSACTVPDTSTYTIHVAPILTSGCGTSNSGCHQTANSSNNFVGLANYADAKDAIDKGLMEAIKHEGNLSPMPKGGGKLSDCMIETIQKWIDQGAIQ